MKTKIDNTKATPDETVFPQLRIGKNSGSIYLFFDKRDCVRITGIPSMYYTISFESSDYFTGSITLSND